MKVCWRSGLCLSCRSAGSIGVTISGILGIPLVNLTGCEIRFVFWLLWASGRVEPYNRRASVCTEGINPIHLPSGNSL
jgi:hypothetical protein